MDFSQSPPAVTYLLHQGHRSWKKATAPTHFQIVQQLGAKQANVWSHGGSILIQTNSVPPKLLLLLALMSDHASLSSCQITEIQKKKGGGAVRQTARVKNASKSDMSRLGNSSYQIIHVDQMWITKSTRGWEMAQQEAHWVLLKRARVWFPGPINWLKSICNSSSSYSISFTDLCGHQATSGVHTYQQVKHSYTYTRINKSKT